MFANQTSKVFSAMFLKRTMATHSLYKSAFTKSLMLNNFAVAQRGFKTPDRGYVNVKGDVLEWEMRELMYGF
jgi:hypothetical protein